MMEGTGTIEGWWADGGLMYVVTERTADGELVEVHFNPDRALSEDAAVEVVAQTMYRCFTFESGQNPMTLMHKIMGRLKSIADAEQAPQKEGSNGDPGTTGAESSA